MTTDTMTTTRPFKSYGLSTAEVRKHFEVGDEIAVSTYNGKRKHLSSGWTSRAVLLSTDTFLAGGIDGFRSNAKALVPTGKAWNSRDVGFAVALLGHDGVWRPVTVKVVFGLWDDAQRALAAQKVAQEAQFADVQRREAANTVLANQIEEILKAKGIERFWSDYDKRTGNAPTGLRLADLATLLDIKMEDS